MSPIPQPESIAQVRNVAAPFGASKAHKRISPDLFLLMSVLGDATMILLALLFAFWVRFKSGWITFGVEVYQLYDLTDYLGLICVGAVFLLLAFGYLRLYDRRNLLRWRRVALIVFRAMSFWLFAYIGVSLALKFQPPISRIYVFISYIGTLGALLSWRWCFHRMLRYEGVASALRQRLLFVGWNQEAQRLTTMIESDPSHPYHIVGCVSSPVGKFESAPPPNLPIRGDYEDLDALLQADQTDIVLLADLNPEMTHIVGLANRCEKEFVQFKVIPSYFQILVSALHLETISGVPILGISELALDRPTNRFVKRVVDIFGAAIGLLLSFPIITICGAVIYWESPGSIFFAQERIGRSGNRFKMYKLRSMKLGADQSDDRSQSTLREDPRLLGVGKIMRKWNLDEVPQFWNVLKGDMSLVGPRPERTFHSIALSSRIPHYNARYATKPGMTGWAQVNGLRGDTDLIERIRYDLFYLENWSLRLDLQIIVQTFFRRKNAY